MPYEFLQVSHLAPPRVLDVFGGAYQNSNEAYGKDWKIMGVVTSGWVDECLPGQGQKSTSGADRRCMARRTALQSDHRRALNIPKPCRDLGFSANCLPPFAEIDTNTIQYHISNHQISILPSQSSRFCRSSEGTTRSDASVWSSSQLGEGHY